MSAVTLSLVRNSRLPLPSFRFGSAAMNPCPSMFDWPARTNTLTGLSAAGAGAAAPARSRHDTSADGPDVRYDEAMLAPRLGESGPPLDSARDGRKSGRDAGWAEC